MRAAAPGHPGQLGPHRRAHRRADRAGAARPGGRRVERAERRLVHPRARRADLDGWAADGNDLWSYDAVLPAFRRLEADRGLRRPAGARRRRAGAGHAGSRDGHPLADAFAAAAAELGTPRSRTRTRDGPPGYGPVPLNVVDGVRVNTAMAYLSPRRGLAGLTVRGGVTRPAGGRRARPGGGRGDRRRRRPGRRGGAQRRGGRLAAPAAAVRASARPTTCGGPASTSSPTSPGWAPGSATTRTSTSATGRPARCRRRPAAAARRPARDVVGRRRARRPGDPAVADPVQPDHRADRRPARGRTGRRGRPAARGQPRAARRLDDGDPRRPPRLAYGYLAEESDRRRLREGVRLAAGPAARRCPGPAGRRAHRPARRRPGRRPGARRLDPRAPDHRDPPLRHRPDGAGQRSAAPSSTSELRVRGVTGCGSSTRRCCRGCRRGDRRRPP